MTIRHLRIFTAVCKEGSLTKAAVSLFMTQPAVSHAIAELETEFQTAFFDRIGRGITLNEAGKCFLEKANQILPLYDELEASAGVLEKKATLRVGSSITIANFWLPGFVQSFEKQCPETPVTVSVASADATAEKLLQGAIDLALLEGAVSHEAFIKQPFSSYHLLAVCAPTHMLAAQNEISPEVLVQQRLLLREKGSAIRDTVDSALTLCSLNAKPMWTSVNSQVLIEAVKAGVGVSILPDILIRRELANKTLHALFIRHMTLRNENSIAYLRGKYQTKAMKTFLAIVTAPSS